MAFWFGVTSMIRSAGLESSGSIPQTACRDLLPALMSSSPSSSSPSTNQQSQHRQRKPQQLSRSPTKYQHEDPPRSPFSSLLYNQRRQILLQSSPIQRSQLQAPPSSRCSYCLTGTGYSWASDDDYGYDYEVVGLRERWREWGG
jgi:hypothetical protein